MYNTSGNWLLVALNAWSPKVSFTSKIGHPKSFFYSYIQICNSIMFTVDISHKDLRYNQHINIISVIVFLSYISLFLRFLILIFEILPASIGK